MRQIGVTKQLWISFWTKMTLPTGYTEVKVPLILFSLTPDPLPLSYDLQTLIPFRSFSKKSKFVFS